MERTTLTARRARARVLAAALGASLLATLGLAQPARAAPGDTHFVHYGDVPTLSPDGRYVGFRWNSWDNDHYGPAPDVYVADRASGAVERISTDATDWEPHDEDYFGNNVAISADGRYVAYMSHSYDDCDGDCYEVLVTDRQTGLTEHVTMFDAAWETGTSSFKVAISADGRFVTFDSHLDSLVPGDTNGALDVFVYDRLSHSFSRVSVGPDSTQGDGPSANATITPDGRYVAFWSAATDLVPGDTNGIADVFLHDRQTGATERVSLNSNGAQAEGWPYYVWGFSPPALSPDARYVAFVTSAKNLVADDTNDDMDVFVRDRVAGTTERVNVARDGSQANRPPLGRRCPSARMVVTLLPTSASNLVPGDTNNDSDVFVRDRVMGHTERVSVTSDGVEFPQPMQGAFHPSLSADGSLVAFDVDYQVFVHEVGGDKVWGWSVQPGAMDFGAQTLLTPSAPRAFTLENTGTLPLPIVRVELRGADMAQFTVTSLCGSTLAAGAKCKIEVAFKPQSVGAKTAKLKLVLRRGDENAFVTKDLAGIGVKAAFTLQPTSLGFGPVRVSTTSAAKYVVVRNTGESVLPLQSVKLEGDNPAQFQRIPYCPSLIAAGGKCTVRVQFKPTSVGPKSATLSVAAGGGAGMKSVALSGRGT